MKFEIILPCPECDDSPDCGHSSVRTVAELWVCPDCDTKVVFGEPQAWVEHDCDGDFTRARRTIRLLKVKGDDEAES